MTPSPLTPPPTSRDPAGPAGVSPEDDCAGRSRLLPGLPIQEEDPLGGKALSHTSRGDFCSLRAGTLDSSSLGWAGPAWPAPPCGMRPQPALRTGALLRLGRGPCFLGGLSSPCSLLSLNRAAPCSPLAPHTAARGLSIGGDETQLLRVRKPVLISPFRISQVTRNVFMPFKLETLSPAPKPSILKAPCRERAAGWAGPGLGLAGHSCGLPGDRAPGQGAPSQKSYFSRNPSS